MLQTGEIIPRIAWLWLYGIKYWLPYGVILGLLSGILTMGMIVDHKENKWLCHYRARLFIVSTIVFCLGYILWPAVFSFELAELLRAKGRLRDRACLGLVIIMLFVLAVISIPGAIRDRLKCRFDLTPSATSPTS